MTASPVSRRSGPALALLASIALVAYGLDQLTKFLVVAYLDEGTTTPIVGDVLQFTFVRNPGAAFSLASGSTWIFSILAAAVVVVIVVLARKIRSLAWAAVFGLLLGGVLGNLTDRLFREPSFGLGHVIDFISTPWMLPAIYNMADIFIVSSMALFVIVTIRGIRLDGSRQTTADTASKTEQNTTEPNNAEGTDRAPAEVSEPSDVAEAQVRPTEERQ